MLALIKTGFLLLAQLHLTWAVVLGPRQQVSCSYASASNTGGTCQSFSAEWGLTVQTFESLNPGVICPDLVAGQSYCVVGTVSSATSSESSSFLTTATTTISTSLPSLTSSSSTSSSSTPYQPQQTGTAANCNQFYLVQPGDSCNKIETQFGISASEFLRWNPSINSACTNILAGYYYCVSVPGSTTFVTTTSATTATLADGITTPTPTQAGMTGKCNKFDLVQTGNTCESIAVKYSIPLSAFYAWNPAVGSSCANLDLGYYVCVNVIGYTVPTKTSPADNGITTPTPFEPGMVSDCKKFYLVRSGDSCAGIASIQGITVAEIEKLNPHVGSTCAYLWLGDYICVGV